MFKCESVIGRVDVNGISDMCCFRRCKVDRAVSLKVTTVINTEAAHIPGLG